VKYSAFISYSLLATLAVLLADTPLNAQFGYLNEEALSSLANSQTMPLDSVPVARYRYYVVDDSNSNWARQRLYRRVGHRRDSGRKELIQMLNRNNPPLERLEFGDTLVVPLEFDLDLRAYTPFPRRYEGATDLEKLYVIDKSLQVFGAYEYGNLVRWGVVSTGDVDSPTPSGRFNFNWRQRSRVSSLSPPGQEWRMEWVFNFHDGRGIHVHQYPLPVGGPVSHGCVRTTPADAEWLYNWADTWKRSGKKILRQGTMLIIVGEDGVIPTPFRFGAKEPELIQVQLPEDPYSIQAGTYQQKLFDRRRKTVTTP
jgi:hypothetical protein